MNRALLLLLFALAPLGAHAATTCRIINAGSLAFGNYDLFSAAPTDSLANVTVTCSRQGGPQNETILMRVGQGVNGTSVNARRMLHTGGSGNTLNYGLYRDVGRSSVWGILDNVNTVSALVAVPNNGSASATFTIYGRIPPQQDVAPGTYGDSVQVTIIY